jgi:hypothetical protein
LGSYTYEEKAERIPENLACCHTGTERKPADPHLQINSN